MRASNAPAPGPADPPPPKTRARFSSKRGELDDVGADVGAAADDNGGVDGGAGAGVPAPAPATACFPAAAPTPSGDVEEPMTPTPASGARGGGGGGGSGNRVTALALAIESRRQEQEQRPQNDETPVMTLPAVITAAEAAGLAAEKRMKDSRNQHEREDEQGEEEPAIAPAFSVGMGVKRVGRVRGRGAIAAQQEESVGPRSVASSSDFGRVATAVSGTDQKSQIQASPQYWVPRKLSRSPVINKNKSASYSPPTPSTRPLW